MSLLAKVGIGALTNEKVQKKIGWVLVAIFSPVIVLVAILCGLLESTSAHNINAIELAFYGGTISQDVPAEYRNHITEIQDSFALLDLAITNQNSEMEDGDSLDATKIKAIFYVLFFGETQPSLIDTLQFTDCFVTVEERTRTVIVQEWLPIEQDDAEDAKEKDEENDEEETVEYGWVDVEKEETYTVKVPIADMGEVFAKIESMLGTSITTEQKANIAEIYYRIQYGQAAPTYGSDFDAFLGSIVLSDVPFVGVDGFCSPIGDGWRNVVSSEFGYRMDPFTGEVSGHSGIDLAMGAGSPIYAALDGTVVLVRYSTSGYGYHVMVDHGGGFVTLYAHCSEILVYEGQSVTAGMQIAKVGSTGRSTGNHLHFEVIINGEKQNPRSYLP